MENSSDNTQQIVKLFSIQNILDQGITLPSAKKIELIVKENIINFKKGKTEKIKETIYKKRDKIMEKSKNLEEEYKKTKIKIKTKYEQLKLTLYNNVNNVVKKYDNNPDFKSKEIEDFDLIFDFSRFHKKILNDDIKIYFNENYLYYLDQNMNKFFAAGMYQLMYELQKFKEIATNIYKYMDLNKVLKYFRKSIILKELQQINDCQTGVKTIGLLHYILKMSKYFLVCFYHNLSMNYYRITYIETCYVTVRLFEYIFGDINTFMVLKKLNFLVEYNEGNYFLDVQDNPYEDEQVKLMENYHEKIEYCLYDLF